MAPKTKKVFSEAVVKINATFNNTHVTFTTPSGDVLSRASAGRAGFKGARKGTPYAGQCASEIAVKEAVEKYGVKRVIVRIAGAGAGRDLAIRAINNSGIKITRLEDRTPLPHNGCRARKKRRV